MPSKRQTPFHKLLLSLEPWLQRGGCKRWVGRGARVQLLVEFLCNPRGEEHDVKAAKRLRDHFLFLQRNWGQMQRRHLCKGIQDDTGLAVAGIHRHTPLHLHVAAGDSVREWFMRGLLVEPWALQSNAGWWRKLPARGRMHFKNEQASLFLPWT